MAEQLTTDIDSGRMALGSGKVSCANVGVRGRS
jgi:hypothetical protein